MVVDFTPDQEAQLAEIAGLEGKNAEMLVKEAALRMLREEEDFLAAIQVGIDQADRGEFIEEDEVDRLVLEMLQKR